MNTDNLVTVAQAAAARGVSESRMRDLIATHSIKHAGGTGGRYPRNLYRAADIDSIPAAKQGARNDLLTKRLDELFRAAHLVAAQAGKLGEWEQLVDEFRAGGAFQPWTVRRAVHRWSRGHRKTAGVSGCVASVDALAEQLGELPRLSTVVRDRATPRR